MFVKVIDGVQIVAPSKYTTEDGYVINNFNKYLETMYKLELTEKMYGFEYVEDIVIKYEDKIKKLEEENTKLKLEQQSQDSFIEVTMMATDEIYMMIEPLLDVVKQQSISVLSDNLEKEVSKMVDFYAAMVVKGLKTIEEVPARYREQVREVLSNLEK